MPAYVTPSDEEKKFIHDLFFQLQVGLENGCIVQAQGTTTMTPGAQKMTEITFKFNSEALEKALEEMQKGK